MYDDQKKSSPAPTLVQSPVIAIDAISFRTHEFRKGVQLPCYKSTGGDWMVPITWFQQMHFPDEKLTDVEHTVSACTKKTLQKMTKAEIRELKFWLSDSKESLTCLAKLTESEYACSCHDLNEQFETVTSIFTDIPIKKVNTVKSKIQAPSTEKLHDVDKNNLNKSFSAVKSMSNKTVYKEIPVDSIKSENNEDHVAIKFSSSSRKCLRKVCLKTKKPWTEKIKLKSSHQKVPKFSTTDILNRNPMFTSKIERKSVRNDTKRSKNSPVNSLQSKRSPQPRRIETNCHELPVHSSSNLSFDFGKLNRKNSPASSIKSNQSVVFLPTSRPKSKTPSISSSLDETSDSGSIKDNAFKEAKSNSSSNDTASCFSHVLDELEEKHVITNKVLDTTALNGSGKKRLSNNSKKHKPKSDQLELPNVRKNYSIYSENSKIKRNAAKNDVKGLSKSNICDDSTQSMNNGFLTYNKKQQSIKNKRKDNSETVKAEQRNSVTDARSLKQPEIFDRGETNNLIYKERLDLDGNPVEHYNPADTFAPSRYSNNLGQYKTSKQNPIHLNGGKVEDNSLVNNVKYLPDDNWQNRKFQFEKVTNPRKNYFENHRNYFRQNNHTKWYNQNVFLKNSSYSDCRSENSDSVKTDNTSISSQEDKRYRNNCFDKKLEHLYSFKPEKDHSEDYTNYMRSTAKANWYDGNVRHENVIRTASNKLGQDKTESYVKHLEPLSKELWDNRTFRNNKPTFFDHKLQHDLAVSDKKIPMYDSQRGANSWQRQPSYAATFLSPKHESYDRMFKTKSWAEKKFSKMLPETQDLNRIVDTDSRVVPPTEFYNSRSYANDCLSNIKEEQFQNGNQKFVYSKTVDQQSVPFHLKRLKTASSLGFQNSYCNKFVKNSRYKSVRKAQMILRRSMSRTKTIPVSTTRPSFNSAKPRKVLLKTPSTIPWDQSQTKFAYNKSIPFYVTKSVPKTEHFTKPIVSSTGRSIDKLIQYIRSKNSPNFNTYSPKDDILNEKTTTLLRSKNQDKDASTAENVKKSPTNNQVIQENENNFLPTDFVDEPRDGNTNYHSTVNASLNEFVTLDEDWDCENESQVQIDFKEDSVEKSECENSSKTSDWPFCKKFHGWTEVFQDFSLARDEKIERDLTTTVEISKEKNSSCSKGELPFQWKKKLIRKAEIHRKTEETSTSTNPLVDTVQSVLDEMVKFVAENKTNGNLTGSTQNKGSNIALGSDFSASVPTEHNLIEKEVLKYLDLESSDQALSKDEFDSCKEKFRFSSQMPLCESTLNEDDVVSQTCLKRNADLALTDKSIHSLNKKETEQMKLPSKVDRDSFTNETGNEQNASPKQNKIEIAEATNFRFELCCREIKQEFPEYHLQNFIEVGEKSSDETSSDLDSETISLRSYAKTPNQKSQYKSESWKLKDCVVSIECLNLLGGGFSNVSNENEIESEKESCTQVDMYKKSESVQSSLSSSSNVKVIQKARKTVRKPKSSNSKNCELNAKQVDVIKHKSEINHSISNNVNEFIASENNVRPLNQNKNNASSVIAQNEKENLNDDSLSQKSHLASFSDNLSFLQKTFTEKNDDINIASRLRSARLKRRPRLPSMSSDEENLTPQSQEHSSSLPKAAIETGEHTDDDQLLISCKPFLSKNAKKKSNQRGTRKTLAERKSIMKHVKQGKVHNKMLRGKLTDLFDFNSEKSFSTVQSSSVKSWVNANINVINQQKPSIQNITDDKTLSTSKCPDPNDKESLIKQSEEFNIVANSEKRGTTKTTDETRKVPSENEPTTSNPTLAPRNVSPNPFQAKNAIFVLSEKSTIQFNNKAKSIANDDKSMTEQKTESPNSECNRSTSNNFDAFKLDLTNNEPIKLNGFRNLQTVAIAQVNSDFINRSNDVTHEKSSLQLRSENIESVTKKANDIQAAEKPCYLSSSAASLSQTKLDVLFNSAVSTQPLHLNSSTSVSNTILQNQSTLIISENDKILSPTPDSMYGETYHHGMMEIRLSAPLKMLAIAKTPYMICQENKLVFIIRRIPYIQLKVKRQSSESQLLVKTKNVDADYKSTILIRLRDAAFSLRIDCFELLTQVGLLGIPCYAPNDYTQCVYNLIYNPLGRNDESMSSMLGFHNPLRNGPVNQDSMINLNDYLRIILPKFYVNVFGLHKNSLPEFVSVTTYKPIDVVTPFVIKTFSSSYSYNMELIKNDMPVESIQNTSNKSETVSHKRGSKRKFPPDNGLPKPKNISKLSNRKKQKGNKTKKTSSFPSQPILSQQIAFPLISQTSYQSPDLINIPKAKSLPALMLNQPMFGTRFQQPNYMTMPSDFSRRPSNEVVSNSQMIFRNDEQNLSYRTTSNGTVINRCPISSASVKQRPPHEWALDLSKIKFVDQASNQFNRTLTPLSNSSHKLSASSQVPQFRPKSVPAGNDKEKTLGARFVEDSSCGNGDAVQTDLQEILQSIKSEDSCQSAKSNLTNVNSNNDRLQTEQDSPTPTKSVVDEITSGSSFNQDFIDEVISEKGKWKNVFDAMTEKNVFNGISEDDLVGSSQIMLVKKYVEENQKALKI